MKMKKTVSVLLAILLLAGLGTNAFAVDFVKSRGGSEISVTPVAGDEYLQLVVTPLVCKEDAMIHEIEDMLDSAEQQAIAAETVASLTPEIGRALAEVQARSTDPAVLALTVEDLAILDIFDVTLVRNGVELVHVPENQAISFSVQTDLTQDDLFFVLHNFSGTSWELVDLYYLHSNGLLDIVLFGLSPLAIIVDRHGSGGGGGDDPGGGGGGDDPGGGGGGGVDPGDDPGGDDPGDEPGGDDPGSESGSSGGKDGTIVSPQTGDDPSYAALYLACACLTLGAAAAACFFRRRKEQA